ncbi:hypothetical protein [Prevotella denticola]|uniref:hypothetical protein n=1 Tax=Prevotella denticola TaxID=28129 RepID=UPI0028E5CE50|nr:hypothetical protein [Prevotella denticola]
MNGAPDEARSLSAETTRSAGPVLDCEASLPSCDKRDGSRSGKNTAAHFKVCLFRPAHARHTGTGRQETRKRAAACTAAALCLS